MQNSAFEINHFQQNRSFQSGSKLIQFNRPLIMGILNCTPDSFFAGSRLSSEAQIIQQAEQMILDGADILDIGGYSTRPGAKDITVEEEITRILPAISIIRSKFSDILISIDTFRSVVAEKAIDHGADLINDISGFSIDEDIIDVAARKKVPYILMHINGTPQNMQEHTEYVNLVQDIHDYFKNKIGILKNRGVENVILDLGFGFSKTIEQNHTLLRHLEDFCDFNLPMLVGISRKSMIYKKLEISPEESLPGTIALNAIALNKGASILRVHDVKEAHELVKLLY